MMDNKFSETELLLLEELKYWKAAEVRHSVLWSRCHTCALGTSSMSTSSLLSSLIISTNMH